VALTLEGRLDSFVHPAPVGDLEEIRTADSILTAAPENDYRIPGVLTDAQDCTLRSPHPSRHKPVGIAGLVRMPPELQWPDGLEEDPLASPSLHDARTPDAHTQLAPALLREQRPHR
jgi:hypothetical protein